MNVLRPVVTIGMLLLSWHAAAFDAALCSEARRNIARLEDNLRRGPTASDRVAFEQALSLNRKMEGVYCSSGPSASGPSGSGPSVSSSPIGNPRVPDAAATLGALAGALQGVPLDAAAYMPAQTGPTLPSPPTPSGSVTGPMTLQRLGGPAVPTVRQPTVSAHEPTTEEPSVNARTPVITQADARPTAARPPSPSVGTPTVNTPRVRTLEPSVPSPFPTDQQISASCASTRNPSMCTLLLQNQRNKDPAYVRFKAEESARMDRNIASANANVDAAIAARNAQNAGPTVRTPVIAAARPTIPVAPPAMPYDSSDPDLAKCREGENAPWTIAGCYDLAGKGPRKPQPTAPESLRDRLEKALANKGSPEAGPTRDLENEKKQIAEWKQRAEERLRDAIRNGQRFVPENRAARDGCNGVWLYDGLSPGRCEPGRNRLVYAVDPPQQQAQQTPADLPAQPETFRMSGAETDTEIQRLTQPPLEPPEPLYGPPVPTAEEDGTK